MSQLLLTGALPRAAVGALLLTVTVLTHACAKPATERGTVGALGTYVLVRVAGDTLPALLLDNGITLTVVAADTIRLHRRGVGFRQSRTRTISEPSGEGGEFELVRERFRYRIQDGGLTIDFGCPGLFSFALCAEPPHGIGELTRDRLILRHLIGSRGNLEYRRIR